MVPLTRDVNVAQYQAVFVARGHAVMWDLGEDPALRALLSTAASSGRIVAACATTPRRS